MGVVGVGAKRVTNSMFLAAAKCLASQVSDKTVAAGCIYPPLVDINKVREAWLAA